MRLALLFSGQGGQGPAHWQQVRAGLGGPWREVLLATVPGIADDDAVPAPETLAQNCIAQPLIFAQQMLLWEQLRENLPRPVCVAGYSLGELAACCVAGAFPATTGLALAGERARLMDGAAPGEHAMLAVLGLDEAVVATQAAAAGLAVAIRNAPRHLVVAGPRAGILIAAAQFETAGANRLVHLPVRTPSHTPRLAGAAAAFRQRLAELPDGRLSMPVLSAIDATPARRAAEACTALARQICTPLDWAACLQAIVELQPDAVLEIGPGNALTRLFGELAPDIPARACDDFRSIEGIIGWVQAAR